MKTPKTPSEMVASWKAGMASGSQKWLQKIQAVNSSPMAAAAAAKQKWVQQLTAVFAGTRWEDGLNSVTLQDWKDACKSKQGNFTNMGPKALNKYTKFANQAQPVYAAMRAAAQAAGNPVAAVSAALQVLMQAGKKQGGNAFA